LLSEFIDKPNNTVVSPFCIHLKLLYEKLADLFYCQSLLQALPDPHAFEVKALVGFVVQMKEDYFALSQFGVYHLRMQSNLLI
jgi:hypothetical protein